MSEISIAAPDTKMPLVFVSSSSVPLSAQKNLVQFLKSGGKLLLFGELPKFDEEYRPCTILYDYIGFSAPVSQEVSGRGLINMFGKNIYGMAPRIFESVPADAEVIAESENGCPAALRAIRGDGEVVYIASVFSYSYFAQAELLEKVLTQLGAEKLIESSNRNILTALFEHEGHTLVMAANPFSSPQSTSLSVRGQKLADVTLPPEGIFIK